MASQEQQTPNNFRTVDTCESCHFRTTRVKDGRTNFQCNLYDYNLGRNLNSVCDSHITMAQLREEMKNRGQGNEIHDVHPAQKEIPET